LLAQADGVCVDMFGEKLFSKQNGKPKTANKVREIVGDNYILEGVVEFLLSGSALMLYPNEMKEKRKDSNYSVLNRHEIMHGADKNYGSETNSLKAISLITLLTASDFLQNFLIYIGRLLGLCIRQLQVRANNYIILSVAKNEKR